MKNLRCASLRCALQRCGALRYTERGFPIRTCLSRFVLVVLFGTLPFLAGNQGPIDGEASNGGAPRFEFVHPDLSFVDVLFWDFRWLSPKTFWGISPIVLFLLCDLSRDLQETFPKGPGTQSELPSSPPPHTKKKKPQLQMPTQHGLKGQICCDFN